MKLQVGEKGAGIRAAFRYDGAGRAVGSKREQTSVIFCAARPSLAREVRNCVPCGTTSMNMKISTAVSLAFPQTARLCSRLGGKTCGFRSHF
jgi:hypothetical protein